MTSSPAPLRAYRLLAVAGCFALGIVASHLVPDTATHWPAVGGVAALVVVVLVALPTPRLVTLRPLARTLALALLWIALGAAAYLAGRALPADHYAHHLYTPTWADGPRWMAGRVHGDVQRRADRLHVTLALDRLAAAPADTLAARGLVRLTLTGDAADTLRLAAGDHLTLHAALRPLAPPRNPADFDYGRYLRRRGIYATARAPAEAVGVRAARPTLLTDALADVRRHVRRHLGRSVHDDDARAVLLALTLGERHHLDDHVRERFVETGLMHLLAVSGLHVLLVGLVLYRLLRPVLLRAGCTWGQAELVRSAATLGVLAGYVLVTGAPPSAVRAVVMTGLALGSVLLQRKTHALNLLGAAALVLLVARPAQLFEPGFQLSFAAVGALVLLTPVLSERVPAALRRTPAARSVTDSVLASTAATLGTLPVLLHHFGYASFAGLLLNVIAIPATMLGLGLALLALLVATLSPAAALLPGAAADVLVRALIGTTTAGADAFAWAGLHAYLTDGWTLAASVLLLAALAALPYPRRRWRLLAAAGLCAAVGLAGPLREGVHRPRLDVVFLDVGQGDAVLLALPGGRHVLVDAGPRNPYVDHGARTVVPHLRRHGIRRLDAVVVTHADSDHLGGLPAVLAGVDVGRLLHNGRPHDSHLYRETMAMVDSLGIPHRALRAGDTLVVDPQVRIHVLAPEAGTGFVGNEASVVLRVAYGETCLLLTGDVEAGAEALLTRRYGPLLSCDVVKVAHHGSRTSSTPAFLAAAVPDAANPPTAVISAGRRNPFGLPAPDIVARWQARGVALMSTAVDGAVWLHTDGHRFYRHEWRPWLLTGDGGRPADRITRQE